MTCTLHVAWDERLASTTSGRSIRWRRSGCKLTMELARAFGVLARHGVTVAAGARVRRRAGARARSRRTSPPWPGTRALGPPASTGGPHRPAWTGRAAERTASAPRTIRSSPGCTRHPRWSPARRWPPPARSGRARPSTAPASPAACITPCAPTPAASASTTTPRSRSPGCSSRAPSAIAYVDIDVHHGDGVQAAFWNDPRVLTISLHRASGDPVPRHRQAAETGGPDAEGSAVNVALPAGTRDAGWLRALHAVVPPLLRAVPAADPGQPAWLRHALERPAGQPADQHRRAAGRARGRAPARARDGRRPVAADRRRRLPARPGRAPDLDAPAGRGLGRPDRPGPADARSCGVSTSAGSRREPAPELMTEGGTGEFCQVRGRL